MPVREDACRPGGYSPVQVSIDTDERWLTTADAPARAARLWRSRRSIVAPVREGDAPTFPSAAARSSARGWPIALRRSGGLAVPHGPDVLCLSLVWVEASPPEPRAVYRVLADVIQQGLARRHASAEVGPVSDAVCSGAWDLALGGRKFAGLAQRRSARRPDGSMGVLAHAVMFCGLDLGPAIAAVNDYYADLGLSRRFSPDAHVNLCAAEGISALSAALTASAARAGFTVAADIDRGVVICPGMEDGREAARSCGLC